MWYESDLDALMSRTCLRPIPTGKVNRNQALILGVTLSIISVVALDYFTNRISAAILLLTILFYVFVYTIWLKRRTPQNIVIGGAAGAIPPIIGWTSVTPEISLLPLSMFVIIFFWTPPHFWALSVYRFNDYAKAKVPMLPNVSSIDETKKQIIYYSVILIASSYLPYIDRGVGLIYFVIATILNFFLLNNAIKLKKSKEKKSIPNTEGLKFFALTIFYLFSLFAGLLIDHVIM